MTRPSICAALVTLVTLAPLSAWPDDVLRSRDGSERVYARDGGEDRQVLVDSSGEVVGYRKRDRDGEWRYTSPDGSKRIYTRERSADRDALVDDEGKVIGYRTQTDDDEWRYTEPDGTFLGTEESED